MIILQVVLVIMCFCTSATSFERDICHYNSDYKCILRGNKYIKSYNNQIKSCSIENVPKDVNFNIMLDEKNSSSRGIVNVDFKSPNLICKYKIALFVNPYINNSEDCKAYQFNKTNYLEIHTLDKTICPKYDNEIQEKERESLQVESSCKENILSLWYEYIYTGCYALGFKIDEDYIFIGNDVLRTEYKKVEVAEPKLRCTYKTTSRQNKSSVEMVMISADISLLAGSSGIKLEVAPTSVSYRNEENFCNRYSENSVVILSLGMSMENETDTANNNCSLTTTLLSNGDLAKAIECNFVIENSPKDLGYCFLVHILDERCHKNTSWKPPLKDKVPCAWTQYCMKTEHKRTTNIEEIKKIDDVKILKIPRILYLILFVAITLVVLAVLSTIFIAYRIHLQRTKSALNMKINKEDFEDDGIVVLELGGSKSQKEKLVKESGIVILYVRESDHFMNFMSEFRKSLKQHTGCDVYDWWAPDLWNDVARVGGYEWVVKMIRKDCRVVWIDTLKARMLFALQNKNGYDKYKQLKNSWHSQEISDFRDSVFPALVDFAKRSNQDIEQEYQRHFVIRLESFENADKTVDPFSDLSPHARYLIPCHLDKLCSQLSIRELYFEDEMNMDKVRLGKYLLQEPVISLRFRPINTQNQMIIPMTI